MARIKIAYPETTLFTHDLSVRVTDLNFADHLAHDSVISLLHEARAQFFVANKMSELDVEGAGIIMADIAVNYRGEAFFGQMLTVEISLGDFSDKGCDIFYRVTCKESDSTVAIAKTGIVFMNYQTRKLVSVPKSFLKIAGK
ncbi:MAG: thioesterase [Gammaproteobacteria bacterium]|jgi:acyl-CoA thioesterase FadM|nr:MAG: thioesterase [Gammaproteobacteria bacterium]RLA23506.1 MAG: thioesterase [Gammaproteobacteria bacterium]